MRIKFTDHSTLFLDIETHEFTYFDYLKLELALLGKNIRIEPDTEKHSGSNQHYKLTFNRDTSDNVASTIMRVMEECDNVWVSNHNNEKSN